LGCALFLLFLFVLWAGYFISSSWDEGTCNTELAVETGYVAGEFG
jgi:hypothetical protein